MKKILAMLLLMLIVCTSSTFGMSKSTFGLVTLDNVDEYNNEINYSFTYREFEVTLKDNQIIKIESLEDNSIKELKDIMEPNTKLVMIDS